MKTLKNALEAHMMKTGDIFGEPIKRNIKITKEEKKEILNKRKRTA